MLLISLVSYVVDFLSIAGVQNQTANVHHERGCEIFNRSYAGCNSRSIEMIMLQMFTREIINIKELVLVMLITVSYPIHVSPNDESILLVVTVVTVV